MVVIKVVFIGPFTKRHFMFGVSSVFRIVYLFTYNYLQLMINYNYTYMHTVLSHKEDCSVCRDMHILWQEF
jgi:hypothetical protein